MKNKYSKYILATIIIIFLDQITKLIVEHTFSEHTSITIIPHLFDFVFVKNTGAAFSIFSGKTAILGVISVIFCIALSLYWYVIKPESRLVNWSFALLFAGAFGNAIDRVFRGSVVDFIQTAFMNFPVFNVADIAITFGAIALMIYFLLFDKSGGKNGKDITSGRKS